MCKGGSYDLADIMVDPVPKADIYPEVSQNIPCLNITQSEATDFMEKEMASISLVPLETREDCLIGSISDLFIKGDTIVVVDGQKAKQIMLFNKQGKFLRKIGNVGSGPGEYAMISQSRISAEVIEILDWQTKRYIKYDYNGDVLKTVTFHTTSPQNLYNIGNDLFLASYAAYHEQWPFALQWLENDSVVASAFPFTLKHDEVAANIFLLDRDKIGFHKPYTDTIYSIVGQQIIPEYTLGIISNSERQAYLEVVTQMDGAEKMDFLWNDKRAPAGFFKFLSMGNLLLITFQKQDSIYLSIVDKDTLQSRNYLLGAVKSGDVYIPSRIVSATENTIMGYMDEHYLIFLSDKSRKEIEAHYRPEDRQLLQTYDYGNNNPIVWLMELK